MSAIFSKITKAFIGGGTEQKAHREQVEQKKQAEQQKQAEQKKQTEILISSKQIGMSEQERIHKIDQEACSQLDKAWKHFFGIEGFDGNTSLTKAFLEAAAGAAISEEQELLAPSVALARAFLNRKETNPKYEGFYFIKFYVPGASFSKLKREISESADHYCFPNAIIYSTMVDKRLGRIIGLPSKEVNPKQLLSRIALPHPNVLGPIGISCNVRVSEQEVLPFALLVRPIEYINHANFSNLIFSVCTASQNFQSLIKFALDIATGLSYLHDNQIVHGNVCLASMKLEYLTNGMIVTGLGKPQKKVTEKITKETLALGFASDIFQFGKALNEIFEPVKDLCPPILRNLIESCFNLQPSNRPTAEHFVVLLKYMKDEKTSKNLARQGQFEYIENK